MQLVSDVLIGIWYDNQLGQGSLKEIPIPPITCFSYDSMNSVFELIFETLPLELQNLWRTQSSAMNDFSLSSLILGGCKVFDECENSPIRSYQYTVPIYIKQVYHTVHGEWVVKFSQCACGVTFDQLESLKLYIKHIGRQFIMDTASTSLATLKTIDNQIAKGHLRYDYISSTIGITERYGQRVILPQISDIFYNDPYTTVKWMDGTVTTVKVKDGEQFDKEFGLAMAIAKKYGEAYKRDNPRSAFRTLVKSGTDISKAVKERRTRKEAKKKLRESEKKD